MTPSAARISAQMPGGLAAPLLKKARSVAGARPRERAAAISAWVIAGTQTMSVAPSRSAASSISAASNTACGMIAPPTNRLATQHSTSPNTWCIGSANWMRRPSSKPRVSAEDQAARRIMSWLSITPLGVPVVPEV